MILFNVIIVVVTFFFMEFVAWATHKYIMHGFLWFLHQDHHVVNKDHKLQKNDFFFLIFAIPSMLLMYIGFDGFKISFFVGIGIAFYGMAYFIVHEVIIHQRLPFFRKTNNKYIRAIRLAHKVHHKQLGKYNATSFGMLIVSRKYFR